jgi:glutamine amidotransferase
MMPPEGRVAPQPIELVDLETGNLGSVHKMLARIGCDVRNVRRPEELEGTQPVLLPGVGHFSKAAESLDASGLRPRLNELFLAGWPILGICVGAQLMCRASEEGLGAGLGWLPTDVRRFPATDTQGRPLRVPHMEWQPFAPPPGILPFDMPPGRVYFAHSYYLDPAPLDGHLLCASEFGGVRFASVARARNALGAQFHPEKSHRHGMAFLSGWLQWAAAEIARR